MMQPCEQCGAPTTRRFCDPKCNSRHWYRRNAARITLMRRNRYNYDPEFRRLKLIRVKTYNNEKRPPAPCEQCGAKPAEHHHDDYDRPDETRWLCRSCHMRERSES